MNARKWLARPIALAVSSCFGLPALANPTGPQVVQGTAAFQGLGTNNLKVTNSPSAVINWQGFSVSQGQVTNFVQQSASSAVLNRVVGADISQIHGQLLSNGRVFLINPAGILIGATGVIDTAGFVGSTLNMLDSDFLAGKLRFTGGPNAGSIINGGTISARHGGSVVLVAPHIENSKDAIIQAPGGELLLAAGQKVSVGGLDPNGVQFEVQAPTDSVLNLGKLIADGGLVGVFAGTLKHTGDIRAAALARDDGGRIVLKAQSDVILAGGSTTRANGGFGGDIVIHSSAGQARVSGEVSATGAAGKGGDIQVLGDRVSVVDGALIDASGGAGGGQLRIGGDYQGGNAAVQNASRTFIGPDALLRADAIANGDGGRVIVWADKTTQFYGTLSARGGARGGNGGFAEVSGKRSLIFAGMAKLDAPHGRLGELLLDPLDLYVDNRGGAIPSIIDEAADVADNAVTISPATLAAIPGNVTLHARRYMRFNDVVTLNGQSLTALVDRMDDPAPPGAPPNEISIAADIITNGGAVTMRAPRIASGSLATISTGGGAITLDTTGLESPSGTIAAGLLTLDAGGGAVTATSPNSSISLLQVMGGSFTASAGEGISLGTVTTAGGPVSLTTRRSQISASNIATNGGSITATAGVFGDPQHTGSVRFFGPLSTTGGGIHLIGNGGRIETRAIATGGGAIILDSSHTFDENGNLAGIGQVDILGNANAGSGQVTVNAPDISTGGNIIDTTGGVVLAATQGNIFAVVNNASSVVAKATRSDGGSVNVTIQSNAAAPINAADVTATVVSNCTNNSGCPGATVNIDALGPGGSVNLGTVRATGRVDGDGDISESVRVTTAAGSILAQPAGAQVSATDVTLRARGVGSRLGDAANPINLAVRRGLTFEAHGAFRLFLNGPTGPNLLDATLGVAPTGQIYTGLVTGGGINLAASADSATVGLENLTLTEIPGGFKERVNNTAPAITFRVPDGALVAQTIRLPEGGIGLVDTVPLPFTLSARDNVTVHDFVRAGLLNPNSLGKVTNISSDTGTITIGTDIPGQPGSGQFQANRDTVSITAPGTANDPGNIFIQTLKTRGNVFVTSGTSGVSGNNGDITVALIDTVTGDGSMDGTGRISLRALGPDGRVQAAESNVGFEVLAGGRLDITAHTMGREEGPTPAPVANPLDVKAPSIVLTSTRDGGRIGFALDSGSVPIVAETGDLTIVAATGIDNFGASFDVSTGAADLQRLSVTANPNGLAVGQSSKLRTNARDYDFSGSGTTLTFFNSAGDPVGLNQFTATDALFRVATNTGSIVIDGNTNVRNADFQVAAGEAGGIDAAGALDGRRITFSAGSNIMTGAIGANRRPESVSLVAGDGDLRSGAVTTGAIGADAVSVTSFNGRILLGDVGSLTSPVAGNVLITANGNNNGDAGSIAAGDVFAQSVAFRGNSSISTGSLDAETITSTSAGALDIDGAIGASRPVHSLTAVATTVRVRGAITGDGVAAGKLDLRASANSTASPGFLTIDGPITGLGTDSTVFLSSEGALNLGPSGAGVITAGDGSSITLSQGLDAPAFLFATLNAGPGGTVAITSAGGITQMADNPATTEFGITAGTISLTGGNISNSAAGSGNLLDLNPATDPLNLTLNASGTVGLDAHNNKLANFAFTKGNTNAAFTLANLNDQLIEMAAGASVTLRAISANDPLNFTFSNAGGIALTGGGIVSGGGNVDLTAAGPIDGTVGGITTLGGSVNLTSTAGSITTGAIDTATPTTGGGPISVVTNCGAIDCGIIVNGDLNTASAMVGTPPGGSIVLGVAPTAIGGSGSITRSGGDAVSGPRITSDSPDSVIVTTSNGSIGTSLLPLLITSPTTVLSAEGSGFGNVFARLTGTTKLLLNADNAFQVHSTNTPFDILSVTTRATGSGLTALTVEGNAQTYSFARGGGILELVDASGTPASSATFVASDGTLLLESGATLTSANLTLNAAGGDLRLEGLGSALTLNNASQEFLAGRDVLITGNVSIETTGSQTFSAGRNLTVQAQNGIVEIEAPSQFFESRANSGSISFFGGANADERVTVTSTGVQIMSIPDSSAAGLGNVVLRAGAGDRASVIVANTGVSGQVIQAGGDITVTGGAAGGTDSIAAITAAESQVVRANRGILLTGGAGTRAAVGIASGGAQQIGESRRNNSFSNEPYQTNTITLQGGEGNSSTAEISAAGSQKVFTQFGTLNVLGGAGDDSFARITASGGQEQRIGALATNDFAYTMSNVNVKGGTGTGAFATITAPNTLQRVTATSALTLTGGGTNSSASLIASSQRIGDSSDSRSGRIVLQAGAAANANAIVSSTSTQQIHLSSFVGNSSIIGGGADGLAAIARIHADGNQTLNFGSNQLFITGGDGPQSFAQIDSLGTQSLTSGGLTMQGGTRTGAYALMDAVGFQSINGGRGILTGGSAANTFARITTPDSQSLSFFSFGGLTLQGGSGADAFARVDAGSGQFLQSNSLTMSGGTAGGTFTRMDSGNSQSISTGNLMMTGAGTAAAPIATAGALIQSRGGGQNISAATMTLNGGGAADSGAMIASLGLPVVGPDAAPVSQSVSASGGISLNALGVGDVGITSATTQTIVSDFLDVNTAGATGNAFVSAASDQYIRTTGGAIAPSGASLRVAALGSGTARIESGASQLLEVDYVEHLMTGLNPPGTIIVGDVSGVGQARITAVDQKIFARGLTVQGGGSPGSTARLTSTNSQAISTVDGRTAVLGGSGSHASASIDSAIQTMVLNGDLNIIGGTGAASSAGIVSSGDQTLFNTKDNATVTGGGVSGSFGMIQATGVQLVHAANLLSLTAGGAADALARITTPAAQTVIFGSLSVTGGTGAEASIDTQSTQILSGGSVTLTGGSGHGGRARVTASGTQTFVVSSLNLTGGTGLGAAALVDSTGTQTLFAGNVGLQGGAGVAASASIEGGGDQILNAQGTLSLVGGRGGDAIARVRSAGGQSLGVNGLDVTGGTAAGAFAKVEAGGSQTIVGGSGDIEITAAGASAAIEGNNQSLTCGPSCFVIMHGSNGIAEAAIRNRAGAQTLTVGAVAMDGNPDAPAGASVLIENLAPTAQSITTSADTTLLGRGSGTVAITSAGTQGIDARGFDVRTDAPNAPLNQANATIQSAGDQTIRTRGVLAGAPNIGARIVSRSMGIARVQSAANQILNIEGQQLVVGSMAAFVPPTAPSAAEYGVGDSLIIATNPLAPASANQTITAGSLYIQGPSSDFRISKLGADTTQTITTTVGGITLIGGSGTETYAAIDPINQTIDSFGNVLLQGGTGRNADAFISASGPQSVISRSGTITLRGGSGDGADALIETNSPFQSVFGVDGSGPILLQGSGGVAGLQRGSDNGAERLVTASIFNELAREQNQLTDTLADAELDTENDRNLKRATQICR